VIEGRGVRRDYDVPRLKKTTCRNAGAGWNAMTYMHLTSEAGNSEFVYPLANHSITVREYHVPNLNIVSVNQQKHRYAIAESSRRWRQEVLTKFFSISIELDRLVSRPSF